MGPVYRRLPSSSCGIVSGTFWQLAKLYVLSSSSDHRMMRHCCTVPISCCDCLPLLSSRNLRTTLYIIFIAHGTFRKTKIIFNKSTIMNQCHTTMITASDWRCIVDWAHEWDCLFLHRIVYVYMIGEESEDWSRDRNKGFSQPHVKTGLPTLSLVCFVVCCSLKQKKNR